MVGTYGPCVRIQIAQNEYVIIEMNVPSGRDVRPVRPHDMRIQGAVRPHDK